MRAMTACLVLGLLLGAAPSQEDADFERTFAAIKASPGESPWMEIEWYPSVWEARQVAAKEGKPIFIQAGSGGAPAAGC